MKNHNKEIAKIKYHPPQILKITLDNEISLALESSPPAGPNEASLTSPEYFYNDPFKLNIG